MCIFHRLLGFRLHHSTAPSAVFFKNIVFNLTVLGVGNILIHLSHHTSNIIFLFQILWNVLMYSGINIYDYKLLAE